VETVGVVWRYGESLMAVVTCWAAAGDTQSKA
jgi:hypothetical protein